MLGAVGETAFMKRRKFWKTGEDGLCCSSSAIQTRLDPSSLLEERSETPIVFVCFFCVVGYPPNWGKRPRYIDRLHIQYRYSAVNSVCNMIFTFRFNFLKIEATGLGPIDFSQSVTSTSVQIYQVKKKKKKNRL